MENVFGKQGAESEIETALPYSAAQKKLIPVERSLAEHYDQHTVGLWLLRAGGCRCDQQTGS